MVGRAQFHIAASAKFYILRRAIDDNRDVLDLLLRNFITNPQNQMAQVGKGRLILPYGPDRITKLLILPRTGI